MCFAYAEDYDLDEDQRDELWFHIRHMDQEFLEWWLRKQRKPRTPKDTTSGAKPKRSR